MTIDNFITNNIYTDKSKNYENKLESALKSEDDATLKEACEGFESYFINEMFKTMRKTINYDDGFIKRSQAQITFEEMLDEEVSKSLAKAGGIGIAKSMYEQIKKD